MLLLGVMVTLQGLLASVIYSLIGLAVFVAGFYVIRFILPYDVHKEIETDQNTALGIVTGLFTLLAWFAILFTGRYPRGLFDFVVGVGRWSNRVSAYAFVLVTDKYPPFSLNP